MSIKLYIFSESKQDYFYIKEKVFDNKLKKEGIIHKISFGITKIDSIIHVKFPGLRKAYSPKQHIHLDKIN